MAYLLTERRHSSGSATTLRTDTSSSPSIDITVYQSTDGDFNFDNSQTVTLSGGSGEENTLSGFTSSEDALYWAKIDITSGELSNLTIETDSDVLISFDHESQWDSLQDSSGVSSSDVGVGRSADSLTHGYEYGSLKDGIVGYWTFDDVLPDEPDLAYDEALGNHGTTNGATYTSGKIGQALSFNGSSDNVNTPTSGPFGDPEFTVSMWVIADDVSITPQSAIDTYDGSFPQVSMQIYNSGTLGFRVRDTNNEMRPSGSISDGIWTHFAGVRNGGDSYLFKNGSLAQSESNSSVANDLTDANIRLGLRPDGNAGWGGDLDEVRIYDRALSLPEVQALYELTEPQKIYPEDTL